MSKFNWDDLKAFLAMARTGRLTVAARQMGVDHSTLSRRIAALEHGLGARLFDRRAVGFVLTAEGERLLVEAERMETMAIHVGTKLSTMSTGLAGTVRLGTPEGLGTCFLAPRLGDLTGDHPELTIELVANPRHVSLLKREADLAISMSRPLQGRLVAEKLVEYELGVFAAPAYLRGKAPISSRADLEAQRWIGYVDDLMWTAELDYLPQISPSLVPQVRISNVVSQLEAVVGGVGLGVLPNFMARTRPELVRVLPSEIKLTRSYWLINHSDMRDLARVKLMSQFLRQETLRAGSGFWR